MPVLSSFISYRPKRKKNASISISGPLQVSSPFHLPSDYPGFDTHPYASPRVLDINPSGAASHGPGVDHALPPLPPGAGAGTYYSSAGSTPRVQLNMPLEAEPLTDWFPTGFLQGDEEEEQRQRGGDEDEGSSSVEDVLADLEAMDASTFMTAKRRAPSPIQIPEQHAPRPASSVSSPESSAVSGTTLARALMANTFVLSADTRQSRYRSGGSALSRMDSATLPRAEYAYPNWRGSMASLGSDVLSPPAAAAVPPVPPDAERVYVPPQTQRDAPPSPPSPNPNPNPSPPTSAKDLDYVLDYYSFADDAASAFSLDSQQHHGFRPPFSPMPEESRAQLSPPRPFRRRDSAISATSSRLGGRHSSASASSGAAPGRFFLGSASSGGARVDWSLRRGSDASDTAKPLLPFSARTRSHTGPSPSISSIPESVSSIATLSTVLTRPLGPPPTPDATATTNTASSVFARLRAGSAPAPIKVIRDAHDPKTYNISLTPMSSASDNATADATSATANATSRENTTTTTTTEMEMEQTFPETPSAFSPGFSIASPGFSPGPTSSLTAMAMSLPAPSTRTA
ncbi:hypothetical protein H0H87_012780, partial [Tephrocybe sp. NHM501043]